MQVFEQYFRAITIKGYQLITCAKVTDPRLKDRFLYSVLKATLFIMQMLPFMLEQHLLKFIQIDDSICDNALGEALSFPEALLIRRDA